MKNVRFSEKIDGERVFQLEGDVPARANGTLYLLRDLPDAAEEFEVYYLRAWRECTWSAAKGLRFMVTVTAPGHPTDLAHGIESVLKGWCETVSVEFVGEERPKLEPGERTSNEERCMAATSAYDTVSRGNGVTIQDVMRHQGLCEESAQWALDDLVTGGQIFERQGKYYKMVEFELPADAYKRTVRGLSDG